MNLYHNNKKTVFPLELEGLPVHCSNLSDDCFIIVDEFVRKYFYIKIKLSLLISKLNVGLSFTLSIAF